jgi:hypothetical protein
MMNGGLGKTMGKLRGLGAMALLVCLLACLAPTAIHARPLTAFDLTVVGLELEVGPATQQVPKGVTSTVTTHLDVPQVSIPVEERKVPRTKGTGHLSRAKGLISLETRLNFFASGAQIGKP